VRQSEFACIMDAIPPHKRQTHIETARQMFHAVSETREMLNGYAFRLPNESELLLKIAEFVSLERLCCPFFGFTIEIEPEGGAVWLALTGRDGVKPFIQAELSEFFGQDQSFFTNLNKGRLLSDAT
jgi:hypothetical protein